MASIARERSFANSEQGEKLLRIVFWVIFHDVRALADFELERIVKPGVKDDLWKKSPRDQFGIQVSWDDETKRIRTARCGYSLTKKGLCYWSSWIRGSLPQGFYPTIPVR